MSMLRRLRLIIAVLMAALISAGCWDMRDINERTPALAVSIDYSQQHGYQVSIAEITLQQGGSAVYTQNEQYGSGATFTQAVDEMRSHISRRLFLGSARIYVFGPGILRDRLPQVTQALMQHSELDQSAYAVGSEVPASKILAQPDGAVHVTPVRLLREFETQEALRDGHLTVRLWHLFQRVHTPGSALIVPMFQLLPRVGVESIGTAIVAGDGRLGLNLDRLETQSLRWLLGIPSENTLMLPSGNQLKTTYIRTKTHFINHDVRHLQVDIALKTRGYTLANPLPNRQDLNTFAAEASQVVTQRTLALIQKLQAANADAPQWNERARESGLQGFDLQKTTITVTVKVQVSPTLSPAF